MGGNKAYNYHNRNKVELKAFYKSPDGVTEKGKKKRDLSNPAKMLVFIGALYGPYTAHIGEGNPVYTGYNKR